MPENPATGAGDAVLGLPAPAGEPGDAVPGLLAAGNLPSSAPDALPSPEGEPVPAPHGGVLRRILTYAPSSLVPALLTLATSMIFTRVFSAAAFGAYSLFLVVANPVKLVATTWLAQSTGKYLPSAATVERVRDVKEAVYLSLMTILIVEGVLGLAAFAVAYPLMSGNRHGLLVAAIVFVVVTSAFDQVNNVFTDEHRAGQYVIFKLTDSVITFALRLLLVSAVVRMDIQLMFWSVAVSNLVLVPFMWGRAGMLPPSAYLRTLRSPKARALTWALLGFGVPMTVWYFCSILLDVGDRFVINHFLGAAPVGIYDANYRLVAGSAALVVVPVTTTLHPYLMSVSAGGDSGRIGRVIAAVVENLLVAGGLAVGMVLVFHADLARVMLGPEFREGSLVMPLVLAGVFFFNIGIFVHKPFEIISRTRTMVVFAAISAAANVAFCFLLIPWLGYLGAAWATLLAYALYTVGVGALGRRIHPWRIDLRWLSGHAALIGGGVVLVWGLRAVAVGHLPYWWGIAVSVVAAGAVSATALFGLLRRRSAY
ncbi:MAG TPA: lipopolysaccharide biosynthesis protein [Kineosporiaceae bacterium]|nr:lipopolysaccharide biosynthesis protein [Kineosporiaceae bacterium]